MTGSWRLAFRLAQRELRRRPVRALLVVLLVAVPVFALTVADVLVETEYTRRADQQFAREHGPASFVYRDSVTDATIAPAGTPEFAPPLPGGSRATAFRSGELPLTPRGGVPAPRVAVTDAGGRDLVFTGARLVDGRAPRRGEVAVSSVVARAFAVGIGDRLVLERPVFAARVVGITESVADDRRALLDAPDFPFDAVQLPGAVSYRVPVVLADGAAIVQASPFGGMERLRLETAGGSEPLPAAVVRAGATPTREALAPQFYDSRAIDPQVKFWSWVGVALLLAMVAVIIAAAFATTARRQLVVLGQLAANGGRAAFLRRMLTLQGTVLGLTGAVIGVVSGLVALGLAHDWISGLYHHELDYHVTWDLGAIALTAVAAATLAARFPARSAARVPVLSALAGRRPLDPVPPLAWLKAVIVFVTGVGLLLLVALRSDAAPAQLGAAVAILGGLLVMAGAAMLTPTVVTLTARWGSRLGVAGRLGTRSLVRVRSRSAAIVTAVAIAGTLAVAVVTGMLGLGVNRVVPEYVGLPDDVVIGSVDGGSIVAPPQGASEETVARGMRTLRSVVPGIEVSRLREVGAHLATPQGPTTDAVRAVVADPQLVRALRLGADERATLRRSGGLVALDAGLVSNDGRIVEPGAVEIVGPGGTARIPTWSAHPTAFTFDGLGVLVAPRVVEQTGAPVTVYGILGVAPDGLSDAQTDALDGGFTNGPDPFARATAAVSATPMYFRTGATVPAFWRGVWSPGRLELWFGVGALAFVLVVVAIGLLLGRAESRDERDVLDALGARPRTERRIAAVQAVALAMGGGLIGVVAGWVPMAAVFRAVQEDRYVGVLSSTSREVTALYPFIRFPWGTAVGVAVLIPIVAGAVAWAATALAQRTRPLRSAVFGAE
jgi:putative ABC transport system permease protein